MAARKKKSTRMKPQYVRGKKRSATESSQRARRSLTIILLLLILGGVAYGIKSGFDWMGRMLYADNPRFEIQHLVISCDGKLGEDYIRETSGLREGMNLFEFPFEEIEDKLLRVSRIESVYLERKLPNTLIVKVKERVPVARIVGRQVSKFPFMIDRFGHILPYRRSMAALPLIKGLDLDLVLGAPVEHADVETVLKIIAICDSTGYLKDYVRIESLDLKYADFIDMRLQGGIRVRLPRFSLRPKLQKLASIIKIETGRGRRVKDVDLTLDSAKVPVSYY
ncbi:MAG: FtsQ-type POTRA domain-containing protein [Pontiella sp.]|nr:FtsQ-type POTRA domain-containing protein [Pontiella sp.]